MNERDVSLFKVDFEDKNDIFPEKECFILTDSYDQAEKIALKKNKNARILNFSKIAAAHSSLFFDESFVLT